MYQTVEGHWGQQGLHRGLFWILNFLIWLQMRKIKGQKIESFAQVHISAEKYSSNTGCSIQVHVPDFLTNQVNLKIQSHKHIFMNPVYLNTRLWVFPGGPGLPGGLVIKNLPCNIEDTVWYLVWEDSMYLEQTKLRHRSYRAHVLQLLEPVCPRARTPNKRSHRDEGPKQHN